MRTKRILTTVLFLFTIVSFVIVIEKAEAKPPAAPQVVTKLKKETATAVAICPAGVLHCSNLSWTASVVDATHGAATGYNAYRSLQSGGCLTVTATTCQKLTASPIAATTFTDSPLTASTTYFYVVTAVNPAGESGPSNQLSLTTNPDPTPNPPSGLTGVAQ